ncbi:MAG TPA: hypothetical protein VK116_00430, partial [Planctomycetota bacterium]|nr:hypothetical protein [Planctomycetota bacterium]
MRALTITSFIRLGFASEAEVPDVKVIRVPDGGIQPEVVRDDEGVVHMIYFSGDAKAGDVFYTRSKDDGASFRPPLRVNSQAKSVIAIGTVRGAQLAVGRDGRVHVAWMGA